MDTQEEIGLGRQAREFRKARITCLLSVVKGFKGWREAFWEVYPAFNTPVGNNLINNGMAGKTSNPDLLAALEEWIPQVEQSQPDWFQKMD